MKIETKIPEGWEEVQIKEICTIKKGAGLSKEKLSENGKNKCILYGELFTTYGEVIDEVKSKTDQEEGTPSEEGDILIPGSTTTTGVDLAKASVIKEEGVLLGGDVNILRNSSNKYDGEFLAYYLTYAKRRDIAKLAQGMTIIHIYGKDLARLKVQLPNLDEQKAIVKIMRSLDEAIKQSNTIINNTRKIKKGTLTELFEQIKKSKKEIGEFLSLESGLYFKFSEFQKRGIRCLKIDNVGFGKVEWDGATYLPEDYITKFKNLILKKGDIVIALNRPIISNKLKIALVKKKDTPSILYQRVGRIKFKDEIKIHPKYFYHILKTEYFKRELKKSLIGSDQPYIKNSTFYKIKIPFPDIERQEAINSILDHFDEKIALEIKRKQKLLQVKQGIMNDLLTGKKRVNVEKVLAIK